MKTFPVIEFDANGTKDSLPLPGGEYAVHVLGTFSSGTMSVRVYDGDNAVEVTDGSLTSNGQLVIANGAGRFRFVLSGASSPDIKVSYEKI
ncbi:MAG: hypothetical protein ACPG32_02730 [Akkermansiaceae bacterium]|jgi:hypothetical protein